MKHLYDGDAASNTLSWRWVAGLQTKGKHYVAQSWNISKFTNNKYKNVKLNENAWPITDRREYKLSSLEINKEDLESDTLIFFAGIRQPTLTTANAKAAVRPKQYAFEAKQQMQIAKGTPDTGPIFSHVTNI